MILSNWMAACRRIQIDSYLSPYKKFKFKWIKYLKHIRPNTLNLIKDKVDNSLELLGTVKDFLNRAPNAKALEIINRLHHMKLGNFCMRELAFFRENDRLQNGKRVFSTISNRRLISKIYKEFKTPRYQKSTN